MAFDVFISYSSHDKPTADAACAALEAMGIRCWIAPRDVSPGRDYGESIIEAMESAKVFVLVLSGNANASPQIGREVERAVSKGLVIFPFRIEDVKPNRNLEYFISSPHWLDAFPPPREKYFGKLVQSVQSLLATSASGAPRVSDFTDPAAAKRSDRRWLGWAVAAVAVLLAIAAGAYFQFVSMYPPPLVGHGAEVDSISFTPDGKLIAAGGWDASIQIWTFSDGKLQLPGISSFQGHAAPFSPDGKTIAGGSQTGNVVALWDVASRRLLQTYVGPTDKVQTVVFSPDGKSLAASGNDPAIYVWNVGNPQPVRKLTGHTQQVSSVAFSNDGKSIASAGFDANVIVWDVAGGKSVKTLTGVDKMDAAIFSSDDTWLATAGGDGNVTIWDTSNWNTVRLMPGDGQIVMTIAFSPDNKLIVSGGYDNAVKVWDTATSRLLRTFTGHTSTVWAVGFSPDGKWIASASGDKTVRLWRTP